MAQVKSLASMDAIPCWWIVQDGVSIQEMCKYMCCDCNHGANVTYIYWQPQKINY